MSKLRRITLGKVHSAKQCLTVLKSSMWPLIVHHLRGITGASHRNGPTPRVQSRTNAICLWFDSFVFVFSKIFSSSSDLRGLPKATINQLFNDLNLLSQEKKVFFFSSFFFLSIVVSEAEQVFSTRWMFYFDSFFFETTRARKKVKRRRKCWFSDLCDEIKDVILFFACLVANAVDVDVAAAAAAEKI